MRGQGRSVWEIAVAMKVPKSTVANPDGFRYAYHLTGWPFFLHLLRKP
jgi:hypothetical protein